MTLPRWEDLSLAQQVAQLIVVRASGHLFDNQIEYPQWEPSSTTLRHWLQDWGVGGVILLGGTASELALRTQQLQAWSAIPLLLAADIEEGVGQRFPGATWFPPPLSLTAIAPSDPTHSQAFATHMGRITAQEARALGLNWLLAPVVDVNNNPANPVINVRAFGETPDRVCQLTTAFIQGAQTQAVLTTAKHFPGHGDTAIDSHLELPVLPHDRSRLETIEYPPFRAAIAAGVDAVMTAHLQLPVIDPIAPATLSGPIITGELRQTLGFDGLIVTDALIMGAITDRYGANAAPVKAIAAGADIVLMPADPVGAIQAICAAVEAGHIPLAQIHASLDRLWRAKHRAVTLPHRGDSSHAWEQLAPAIEPDTLVDQIATPTTAAIVTDWLQHSLHLRHLPLSRPTPTAQSSPPRNLLLLDDLLNSPFLPRLAPAITYPQQVGYRLQRLDRYSETAPSPLPTLLQVFIRDNPFRPSASLLQMAQDWITTLLKADCLQALVIYGSPYAANALITSLPAAIPYLFSYGQMPIAQKLAMQHLFGDRDQGKPADDRQFTD